MLLGAATALCSAFDRLYKQSTYQKLIDENDFETESDERIYLDLFFYNNDGHILQTNN